MDRGILQGDIEKLASASVTQLTRRFKEYTGIDAPRDMFNQGAFGSYLRYLVIEGSEVTRAIIKPSHFLGRVPAEERNFFKDIADRTEASYRQLLTEGTGSFERLFAFYPRAAVLTEPIPEDVIEGSPFRKKIKAELFRLNRRIRSKVGYHQEGRHLFSTEKEYYSAIKDPIIKEIMLKYTTSDQTYFMFRAEMSTSNPKINGPSPNGAGWLVKWAAEKKIPVFIIPSISEADLERLIILEKKNLSLVN